MDEEQICSRIPAKLSYNLAGVDLLNLVKQNPKMEISAMSLPDGLGHLLQ